MLLEVRNLVKHFQIGGGLFGGRAATVKAVDGVSFSIRRGETLGLVGESGCGKTTTGRTILRLEPPASGEVIFEGRDMAKLSDAELRGMRRRMQVIFQDPYSSLNPRMTVGQIISEPLAVHGIVCHNEPSFERRISDEASLGGAIATSTMAAFVAARPPSMVTVDGPAAATGVGANAKPEPHTSASAINAADGHRAGVTTTSS